MTDDSDAPREDDEEALSLRGASVISAAADMSAWRLPDGRVCLQSMGKSYALEPDSTLRLDYGGMPAITGIVSIVVWLTQHGKRSAIFAVSVDVLMGDDPDALRKRYAEVLQLAAAEAGASFEA